MDAEKNFLKVNPVPRVRYKKNFIRNAVCELRFPTLLELESNPPTSFQAKIRRQYPYYEPQIIEVGNQDAISREHRYLFRSKDQQWTVTVKSFALALETSKYQDFEGFSERLESILNDAKEMIDSDFFTRVGLRYINWIPITDGNLDGWVRQSLISPLISGELGTIDTTSSIIQGNLEKGKFSFRQSLKREGSNQEVEKGMHYVLDMDYFDEDVELKDLPTLLKSFNETNFSFFNWCLGDKALNTLGEGIPKK